MLKELFVDFWNKAIDSVAAEKVIRDGREYLVKGMEAKSAFKNPTAEHYQLGTLTGLVEYLTANKDNAKLSDLMVHVRSPKEVTVESGYFGPWLQRHEFARATTTPQTFRFGDWHDQESFMIAMMSYFAQTDVTAMLAQFAGGVKMDDNAIFNDNGVGQQVTVKTGVASKALVEVPNPVELAPFRTFLEVEQPASKFVFRVCRGSNGPQFALFEADGGNWQLEAMQRVRTWLMENLPKDAGLVVLA